jgi:divalent metal cation (Fe/Co/Zn/Cd) transporter
MLIGAALGIAIAAVGEIVTPHHAPAPFTLVVIAVVVLVKEILSRKVLRVSQETGSTAVKADAWHHRSDALTSAAAFIGISVALGAGPAGNRLMIGRLSLPQASSLSTEYHYSGAQSET